MTVIPGSGLIQWTVSWSKNIQGSTIFLFLKCSFANTQSPKQYEDFSMSCPHQVDWGWKGLQLRPSPPSRPRKPDILWKLELNLAKMQSFTRMSNVLEFGGFMVLLYTTISEQGRLGQAVQLHPASDAIDNFKTSLVAFTVKPWIGVELCCW